MMTNIEVEYLDNILSVLPDNEIFSIDDFLAIVPQNEFRLLPTEVLRAEPLITTFLVEKGFADYAGNDFLSFNQGRRIILTNEGRNLKIEGSYRNYARDLIQESNQLIRLDWMLSFMAEHSAQGIGIEQAWTEIKQKYPTMHVEFLESYREQMIAKLVGDKYLSLNSGTCKVTLKGLLFDKEGGYVGEHKRKNAENTRMLNLEEHQRTNQRDTTRLTLLLAIFALISIFIQSFDKFHVVFGIHFWTAIFIFLAGILTSTVVFLLSMEILYKKKKNAK